MKILELVKANYNTYRNASNGERERHWRRLATAFSASVLLATFSSDASAAYPIMVTGITILTGFTFTALFSNHVLADVGLPKPSDESDRLDLKRLSELSENFKARSAYFIALSIIDAVLLIAASLKFSSPKVVSDALVKLAGLATSKSGIDLSNFLSVAPGFFSETFFVFVTFVFLECLYTFFRLSETIIAIVDLRGDYMKAFDERNNLAASGSAYDQDATPQRNSSPT